MAKPKFLLFLFFTTIFSGSVQALRIPGMNANPDLDTIRNRFISLEMQAGYNAQEVVTFMNSLLDNGAWPDIDYENVARNAFQHASHLDRLVNLCLAYRKPGSALKGDPRLRKAIHTALSYWLTNDFQCENWWWNEIGTPTKLLSVLLILDEDLTKEEKEGTLAIVGRANMEASGARPSGDRIKIAGILARNWLFQRDEKGFNEVIKIIEGEIKFASGRGMQVDFSFHHRTDQVNNTLSYGTDYADVFAAWAANVAGTSYRFSEKSLQLLTDYYLDGICKMLIYGKYPDPGAKNREITRLHALRPFHSRTPKNLLAAGNYRKAELEEIVRIREGQEKPTRSFATFFWRSEYFAFQRPDFYTSVRMFSSRNHNMEWPYNGEGLLNYYLGDGSNFISRTGDEYFDISPVLDWQKIPGTTIVQNQEMPSGQLQQKGLTDFVGAVTDGKYGAVAFDYKSPFDPLAAKKAWFFFDEEYVCLGAGICSEAGAPVVTTLNQCLLRGNVSVKDASGIIPVDTGEVSLKGVIRVFHNGVEYYFPEPADVVLASRNTSGSWFRINNQWDSPKRKITLPVFGLWLDHGIRPQGATYRYIVSPVVSAKEKDYSKIVDILINTPEVQAVWHKQLNLLQAVFYQPGEIKLDKNKTVSVNHPAALILQYEDEKLRRLTVADPSRKVSSIEVSVFSGEQRSTRTPSRSGAGTAVSGSSGQQWSRQIDLPAGDDAGRSVTIDL
ncbi:MAG: polysaccharide lyase family 8 super-sandwich domain-containing protein [Mangrovibacterium sp.]